MISETATYAELGLCWAGSLLGTIFVHEAGHALGGMALGFRILSFSVGPVHLKRSAVKRDAGGWRVTWSWKKLTAGLVTYRINDLELTKPAFRYGCVVACGPLANFVFAGVIAYLSRGVANYQGRLMLHLPTLMSFLMAVGSLIPISGKPYDSDGRTLSRLIFDRSDREFIVAKLMFVENFHQFRADFTQGRSAEAASLLPQMRRACRTSREEKMLSLVDHLQHHVTSGEPFEQCNWSLHQTRSELNA